MFAGPWTPEQERLEVQALSRAYTGLRERFRLESLGERLRDHPPLAVRHSSCGFAGDRWRIELDDGSVLRLKLYWPRRAHAAALCSLRWFEGEGWRALVRTADGGSLLLRAFRATLADQVVDQG